MPTLPLAAGPIVSDDVSVHGIVAALTDKVATRPTQVAAAFLAALAVLAAAPIVVPPVIAAISDWFFGTDDDNPHSYPRPSPHHRETRLLRQPPTPPSYTRNSYTRNQSQTAGQTPAIPDYYRSSYSSTLPASARTQASHQPPSTSSRSQTTVRNPSTTDYDRSLHGPSRAPPPAGESRQPSPVPADLSDVESEIEYIEDDDIAKELRDRARRQHREMCDARARAKSARKRGDYATERTDKQKAIARRSAMDQLNTRAAEIIFKQKNKGRKEGMVDFHGLYVHEAVRYAKQELESASRRDDEVVRFIVGKGLHAEDGEAKIRPALEKLCNERGLTHSLDPRNTGVLIVQLD